MVGSAHRFVMLGPPASGKGTQGRMLADSFSVPYLSTGSQLRREIKKETDIGLEAYQYLSRNQYVPDELALQLVDSWIQEQKGGWVLDGFPRSRAQVESLLALSSGSFQALHLVVSKETLRLRVKERRECPECAFVAADQSLICERCEVELIVRSDDSLEGFEKRFVAYEQLTLPAVKLLEERNLLFQIDGSGSREEVALFIRNRFN